MVQAWQACARGMHAVADMQTGRHKSQACMAQEGPALRAGGRAVAEAGAESAQKRESGGHRGGCRECPPGQNADVCAVVTSRRVADDGVDDHRLMVTACAREV